MAGEEELIGEPANTLVMTSLRLTRTSRRGAERERGAAPGATHTLIARSRTTDGTATEVHTPRSP